MYSIENTLADKFTIWKYFKLQQSIKSRANLYLAIR